MLAEQITSGRPAGLEVAQFAFLQLTRDLRFQHRIGAGGPATQMRLRHRREFEARIAQHLFGAAAHLLAVLQRTRRVVGDLFRSGLVRRILKGSRQRGLVGHQFGRNRPQIPKSPSTYLPIYALISN